MKTWAELARMDLLLITSTSNAALFAPDITRCEPFAKREDIQ